MLYKVGIHIKMLVESKEFFFSSRRKMRLDRCILMCLLKVN